MSRAMTMGLVGLAMAAGVGLGTSGCTDKHAQSIVEMFHELPGRWNAPGAHTDRQ